jgi:hypothetical protein
MGSHDHYGYGLDAPRNLVALTRSFSTKTRMPRIGSKSRQLWLAGNLDIWKYGCVKTTLEIPDSLFKELKAKAAMQGLKMKDVVASALRSYLTQLPKHSKRGLPKCPFPLVRGPGGPLLTEMNNQTIAKLDEEDDFERYRRSFGR